MEKMKLKDLINIRTGKLDANASSENGKYPFFTCSKETLKINTYSYDCECVLLAGNGDLNVKYYNGKFDAYQRTYILECKNDIISTKYLYYFMKKYLKILRNQSIGGVIKYIKLANISEAIIPIYSKEEQEEIVNNISKVEEVLNIKNKQIEELQNFIKSQFVEMFGDIKNSIKLGECCSINARIGWQSLTKKEHMETGEYILVTGTDFRNNEIDYTKCVYVSKERYEMDKKIILKNDDILITKDGTIGKVAVVKNLIKPATLNSGIFVVRPDNIFNKEYIIYVFKGHLFKEFINKAKTGATIKHLNQNKLIKFEIPKPRMEEQIKFSNIYKQIDKQKFEIEKSLKETQELYESLMEKYFG